MPLSLYLLSASTYLQVHSKCKWCQPSNLCILNITQNPKTQKLIIFDTLRHPFSPMQPLKKESLPRHPLTLSNSRPTYRQAFVTFRPFAQITH